ncbi:hypothetical protein ZWY2020_055076 [Hordeum vulgare]|nr:hypothetical protein ZWY2020_055076 [Hordeum vulgare]
MCRRQLSSASRLAGACAQVRGVALVGDGDNSSWSPCRCPAPSTAVLEAEDDENARMQSSSASPKTDSPPRPAAPGPSGVSHRARSSTRTPLRRPPLLESNCGSPVSRQRNLSLGRRDLQRGS